MGQRCVCETVDCEWVTAGISERHAPSPTVASGGKDGEAVKRNQLHLSADKMWSLGQEGRAATQYRQSGGESRGPESQHWTLEKTTHQHLDTVGYGATSYLAEAKRMSSSPA